MPRPGWVPQGTPLTERIKIKSEPDPDTECWEWLGYKDAKGYGRIEFKGSAIHAHRVAYLSFIGEIPPGMVVDHLCRNRGCVNPNHLEAVPVGENTRRGAKGWALNGGMCHADLHDITRAENVKTNPDGKRYCLPCQKNWVASRKGSGK